MIECKNIKSIKNTNNAKNINHINNIVTVVVLGKQEGITDGDMATAEDLGDYLLKSGKVDREEYIEKHTKAKKILKGEVDVEDNIEIDKIHHVPFSVAISVYKSDNPIFFDRALNSITENQTITPNEIVLVVDG